MRNMYDRHIQSAIFDALADTPVLLINGARQTGKSTLCQRIVEQSTFDWRFVTMDDPATLSAAKNDPMGFLEDLGSHVIIDEVQRAPELFLPIKKLVDQDRDNRRIILTGSADVMMLPKVGDSLAGRVEIHKLWPLSQDELHGEPSSFIKTLTDPDASFVATVTHWPDIAAKMRIGGYPESLSRKAANRRRRWFDDYLTAILQKDIRDLSNIEGLNDIPNILKLLATRVGSTLNMAEISRLSGVKNTTLKRYITMLEHIFIIVPIPAWTRNAEGEFVKSPKIFLNDTGLLVNFTGREDDTFLAQRAHAGPYLENFVVMEIMKQLSWSEQSLKPYHFSMHRGAEVDLVLEDRLGGLYGIEIKSAASLQKNDFKGLKHLADIAGDKFQKGTVLYSGSECLSGFGEKLQAVPINALWQ